MSGNKLTDRAVFGGVLAPSDLLHIVDVSDHSQDPAGSSYALQLGQLSAYLGNTLATVLANGNTMSGHDILMAGEYLRTSDFNHSLSISTAFGVRSNSTKQVLLGSSAGTSNNYLLLDGINNKSEIGSSLPLLTTEKGYYSSTGTTSTMGVISQSAGTFSKWALDNNNAILTGTSSTFTFDIITNTGAELFCASNYGVYLSADSAGNKIIDLTPAGMTIGHTGSINMNLGGGLNLIGYLQIGSQTASTVPYLDSLKRLVSSSVTPTELSYLSGTTSNIQNQINNINIGIGGWKAPARVLTASNVNISSPGTTIDSITMNTNDRVVLNGQTTGSENGVYVYNGSSSPMTRSTDCSTGGTGNTGVLGMVITIEEGTYSDQMWVLSNDAPITIGTTVLSYVKGSNTTYTGSNGITLTGNNFTLDNSYFSGDATISGGVISIGAGKVTNSMLVNSFITINTLNGLTGGASFALGGSITLSTNATSANTASTIVSRDSSGNFIAGTITAALTGNASTATTLQTARTIQGVSFDGSANINIINGTGFVKASGTTISYDNSTYLTTSTAASTYAPIASPTFTGTVTLSGDATTGLQAVTYQQWQASVQGQNFKEAAKYATTAALPAIVYNNSLGTLTAVSVGALTLDGSTPSAGDYVLIKNQASSFQNGWYVVTTAGSVSVVFVLTRRSDANASTDFKTGDSSFVTLGSTLSTTTWAYTGIDNPTLGTDAITFAQTGGQGSFIAGSGITISGTTISITTAGVTNAMLAGSITASNLVGTDITTVGTITTGTWSATAIADNKLAVSYIKADGSRALTADWAVGTFNITGIKSFALSGTGGNGYGEFIAQSSNVTAPSSAGFRIFAGSAGNFNWARKNGSDTFVRTFDATLTTDRTYTLQDASSTIAMYSNNLSVFASTTSAQLLGIISNPTGTGSLVFGSSPTLGTPILSNATSNTAGAKGYDNVVFYGTPDSSNQGVIPAIHFIRANSPVTLLNSTTSAQPLFQSPTNGTLTLPTGTYRFECLIYITAMSATSGNGTFSLAGGATLGSILMHATGVDGAPLTSPGTYQGVVAVTSSFTSPNMVTASTGTACLIRIKGTFQVTGTGTVIPSFALTTAIGTATVNTGSFFECWKIGNTSIASVGNWS